MLRHSSRLLCSVAPRLPTLNLADAPIVLPNSRQGGSSSSLQPQSIEAAGHLSKEWIATLPQYAAVLRSLSYVPPAQEFWHRPKHEAFKHIVSMLSYFDLIHYVEKEGYTFLISDLLVADDAPLPHLVYEDIMKALMFCSKQDTMDRQFTLDPSLLRTLFCQAAHHVLLDPNYFSRVEQLFKMVEQQQQLSSELLSAWVMVLACAGMPAEALTYARLMDAEDLRFDPVVFSLMLHPHLDPTEAATVAGGGFSPQCGPKYEAMGPAGQAAAKGALQQQRLQHHIQNEVGQASASAIHGLFHFYNLTMNHSKKWETIRVALEDEITLSSRTVDSVTSIFRKEQGIRCGPLTCVELCGMFAEQGDIEGLLMTLVFQRKSELLPEFINHGHYEYQYAARQQVMSKAAKHCAIDPDWDTRFRPAVEALLDMGNHQAKEGQADHHGRRGESGRITDTLDIFKSSTSPPPGVSRNRSSAGGEAQRRSPLTKLKFGPLVQLLRGKFRQGGDLQGDEASTSTGQSENQQVNSTASPAESSVIPSRKEEEDLAKGVPGPTSLDLPVVTAPTAITAPASLLKPTTWVQCVAYATKPIDKGGVLQRRPKTHLARGTTTTRTQIVAVETGDVTVHPVVSRANQDVLTEILSSTDLDAIMNSLNQKNITIGTTGVTSDGGTTSQQRLMNPAADLYVNQITGRSEQLPGSKGSPAKDRLKNLRESVWADPSLLELDN